MAKETPEAQIRRLVTENIDLVAYDSGWPEMFKAERAHLESCLPADLLSRIEHFGSTAIPGIAAKPIVDVLVEVTDLEQTKRRIVPLLESQGYEYIWRPTRGDDGPPWYAWFIKRHPVSAIRTHHIHMVEADFPQWECLLFRDYLIARPDVAREYEVLKRRLALEFPNDRVAYTNGKTAFVVQVTNAARQA